MIRLRIGRVSIAALGAFVAAVAFSLPVRAEGEVGTQVIVRPIEPIAIGTVVEVVVELRRADSALIADEPVTLTIDGAPVRRSRTKADGTTAIRLPRDLAPGTYDLVATYDGRRNVYFGSSGRTVLEVRPYQLAIETVPSVPGMVFSLDGEAFEADADGIARIAVAKWGDHRLAVHEDQFSDPDKRVEFSRWNADLFGPEITLTLPHNKGPLQAGFDIYRRASQTFVDGDGRPIDPSRIASIGMRSSLGIAYDNPDGAERWYKASRAVRRPKGLESVDVRYNVESIIIDGSNVVNAGQQRFYVDGDGPWEIELLLYSARMSTSDALFGFPAGEVVEVLFPDRDVLRVEPDENGVLETHGLARGEYRMRVADAPGWAPSVPVALSKDQEVVLRVVSYLDIAVALMTAAGLALGLLHIGRPHLVPDAIRGIGRGGRSVVTAPGRLAARIGGAGRVTIPEPVRTLEPAMAGANAPIRSSSVSMTPVVAASIGAPPGPIAAGSAGDGPGDASEAPPEPETPHEPLRPSTIGLRIHTNPHPLEVPPAEPPIPVPVTEAAGAPPEAAEPPKPAEPPEPAARRPRARRTQSADDSRAARRRRARAAAADSKPPSRSTAAKPSSASRGRRSRSKSHAAEGEPRTRSTPSANGVSGSAATTKPRSSGGGRKPDPAPEVTPADPKAMARQSQLAALGIGDPGVGPLQDGDPPPPEKPWVEPEREVVRASIEVQAWWHRCPRCGTALIDGIRYCRTCGRLQLASKPQASAAPDGQGLLAKTQSVVVAAPQPEVDGAAGEDEKS